MLRHVNPESLIKGKDQQVFFRVENMESQNLYYQEKLITFHIIVQPENVTSTTDELS